MTTNRLGLPLIEAAQAQKHVTHNEALAALDALVQLSVSSRNVTTPPAMPGEGARVLIGAGATGVFEGKDGQLAAFDGGLWWFFTPRPGWCMYVESEQALLVFDGTAWTGIAAAIRNLQNLATLGIGTSADTANPLAAKLNAALFTARGTAEGGSGDLRFTLNKTGAANTVSQLYQSNYSGRAETGLTGNDNFQIKVSADGSSWRTGLVIDAATGAVMFGNGRTAIADASYTALPTDRVVCFTALTAARVVTLPPAIAFPQGAALTVVDESGACSAANAITLAAAGTDTINGAASAAIASAYGYLALQSNGANKWTIVDQPASGWTQPQGRLTLASGVPVMNAAVSGATAAYYTPHTGNLVALWNGGQFVTVPFGEVSQSLADATKSPSAAAAGQVYDLFGWLDGRIFRVTRGPAWSAGATPGSNAARGSGAGSTALTRVQGVLVNQYDVTNGPRAGFGTYLGTIATDPGGATVTFNKGSAAVGGGAATVGLWNMYNRVLVGGTVSDTTASWTWGSAAWRAANGSASIRVTFVTGLAEDTWTATYSVMATSGSAFSSAGVGLDSTTTLASTTSYGPSGYTYSASPFASAQVVGQHFMSAIEYSAGGNMTCYGTAGWAGVLQSGLAWQGRY